MSQPLGLHDPRGHRSAVDAATKDPWAAIERAGGGVPERFIKSRANIQDLGAKWSKLPEKPTSVFITGPVGVGKSHLASGLLAQWLPTLYGGHSWPSYKWVYWPKVALAILNREGIAVDRTVLLLVIDDIAWQVKRQEPLLVLEDLINHRWERELPTIVTSNMPLEDWDAINPRIASRLSDGYVVQFSGDDRRTRAGKVITIEEAK